MGYRTPLSYHVSEDADLKMTNSDTGEENDDDLGDRINFGAKNKDILNDALKFCQLAQGFWQNGDIENAISSLDQAYAQIIKVDTFNRPRLIQQKEDLRFLITRRIQDIYASRNDAAKKNYSAIPRVMNEFVKSEIESLTNGSEKDFFINAYQRSGRYRKQIESELVQEGLPTELAWLPLIESGFNVKAMSPARALGLWQFIPSTGYRFGLTRDKYIDERLDPDKSTKAAISYLKELHDLFGDWETVLAAYNCGEGRVMRVINTQSINYLDNFWDLYQKLPQETARYVPRFMATLQIVSHPDQYGLTDISPESPVDFDTVPVSRQLHVKNIADATGIMESILKKLNPELRYDITPGDNYPFKIPRGSADLLMSKLDDIPEVTDIPNETSTTIKGTSKLVSHKVKRGETLASLAKKYHTSPESIAHANKLKKSSKVQTGKVLMIPQKSNEMSDKENSMIAKLPPAKHEKQESSSASPTKQEKLALLKVAKKENSPPLKTALKMESLASSHSATAKKEKSSIIATSSKKPDKVKVITYIVKNGDSLYSIARRYGVTAETLQKANKLSSSDSLSIGQNLAIPDTKPKMEEKNHLKKYLVKKNDNAFSISSSHNMPMDRFLSINNLSAGSKIFPGQNVNVE